MENKEVPRDKRYYPLLAGQDSFGRKLTNEQSAELWRRFDELSEETRGILMAPEMPKMIEEIQRERSLSDEKIETISAIVREYFVFQKDEMWLNKALTIALDQKDVLFVKEYIQKNILHIRPKQKASEEKTETSSVNATKTVPLPILDALSKYQRISDQIITESRITLKGESAPVRGSIRYWLRHYRDVLGIRKHSSMERGQFLFQGENTRRLNAQDREKLSQIFRSVDENTPLAIDVEKQEVVFPVFEEKKPSFEPFSPKKQVEETLKTSFRPLEKFPENTEPIQKALEWNGKVENVSGFSPALTSRETIQKQSFQLASPVYSVPSEKDISRPTSLSRTPFEGGKKVTQKQSLSGSEAFSRNRPDESLSAPVYMSVSPAQFSTENRISQLKTSPNEQQGGSISFSSSHILPHEQEDQFRKERTQEFQKKETEILETAKPVGVIRPRGNLLKAQSDEGLHQMQNGGDLLNFGTTPRVVDLRNQKN